MNKSMRPSKSDPSVMLCGVRRAYRGLSSIGDDAYCENPVKTERGYCLRHDPVSGPQRDAKGRIVKKGAELSPTPSPGA